MKNEKKEGKKQSGIERRTSQGSGKKVDSGRE